MIFIGIIKRRGIYFTLVDEAGKIQRVSEDDIRIACSSVFAPTDYVSDPFDLRESLLQTEKQFRLIIKASLSSSDPN